VRNDIKRNPVVSTPLFSNEFGESWTFSARSKQLFIMRKILMSLAVTLGGSLSLMATYIPYPNPGTIAPSQTFTAANSGDVMAYFYGTEAGYDEKLGLFVNGQQMGSWSLDDHTSAYGQSVDFGYVTAGTKLVFAIDVTTTKNVIYSDPTLNSDGDNHAYATAFSGQTKNGVTIPSGTYIGFEDELAPKSNFNYSDEQFVLANTSTSPLNPPPVSLTPEPSSLLPIAIGLVCVGFGSLRRRSKGTV
jgi:hypothetical protein